MTFTTCVKISFYSLLVFILFPGTIVAAEDQTYGAFGAAQKAGLETGANVSSILGNVIGAALTFVGVLFFILMIYAGILWMTSRGNTDQSDRALSTITAAIIGLVLVIAAYAITSFVFKSLKTGPSGSPVSDAGCCIVCDNTGACQKTTYFNSNASQLCQGNNSDPNNIITATVDPNIPSTQCPGP